METLRFASVVIGSIGESLSPTDEEDLEVSDAEGSGGFGEKDSSSGSDVPLDVLARKEREVVFEGENAPACGSGIIESALV